MGILSSETILDVKKRYLKAGACTGISNMTLWKKNVKLSNDQTLVQAGIRDRDHLLSRPH